jgi:hypothetical protein
MPYKIIHKQIGWRTNSLRGYSRPKFGHVLTNKAIEYISPLARRTKSREAIKLLIALALVVIALILFDALSG